MANTKTARSMTRATHATELYVGQILPTLDGNAIRILTKTYVHPNKYRYTYTYQPTPKET